MISETRIQVQCPHCGKALSVNRQYAGKWGKCKQCGKSIQVPIINESPTTDSNNQLELPPSGNLINCPDCRAKVSRRAPSCPQCGCPIAGGNAFQMPQPLSEHKADVQTIEQTGKGYKALMLIGALLMIGSIGGCTMNPDPYFLLGFLSGLIVYIWARVGAWWNHG